MTEGTRPWDLQLLPPQGDCLSLHALFVTLKMHPTFEAAGLSSISHPRPLNQVRDLNKITCPGKVGSTKPRLQKREIYSVVQEGRVTLLEQVQ